MTARDGRAGSQEHVAEERAGTGRTEPLPVTESSEGRGRAEGGSGERVRAFLRAHWLILALLAAGVALRIIVAIAYDPALFRRDSIGYLRNAEISPRPWGLHPFGYSSFLRILPFDSSLGVISGLQHVMGLGIGLLLYATLARLGVRRWLAALGAAPILLDAYQLNIEQHILSETLFELLLVAGCAFLVWRRPLSFPFALAGGLALAAAALTRSVGTFAIAPAVLAAPFLAAGLPPRARLVRTGALVLAFAVPLVGYAAWFQTWHGDFALTGYTGRFLYGRVAPFVDCTRFSMPAYERGLCPKYPPELRMSPNEFMWSRKFSPVYRLDPPSGKTGNDVVGSFSRRVIRHQPLDYAEAVGSDFVRSFAPTRSTRRGEIPVSRWQFQPVYYVAPPGMDFARQSQLVYPARFAPVRADSGLARFLRGYQRVVYTRGPLLALAMLLGFAAAIGAWRARASDLRAAAFLFAGAGFIVLLGSVAATVFSWRYHLPQIVLFPPAGAIGVAALLGLGNSARSGNG
jgi:hypothetical protein